MNRDELIKFIIDNIDMANSELLISYISSKNLTYSENKNGLFLNISLLSTDILAEIYEIVIIEDFEGEKNDLPEIKECDNKRVTQVIKKYEDIKLSPLQKTLIKYSE